MDLGRVSRDPFPCPLQAFVRSRLVLADRDRGPAFVRANEGVAFKAFDRSHQAVDVRFAPLKQIEQLFGSSARIGSDHRVRHESMPPSRVWPSPAGVSHRAAQNHSSNVCYGWKQDITSCSLTHENGGLPNLP